MRDEIKKLEAEKPRAAWGLRSWSFGRARGHQPGVFDGGEAGSGGMRKPHVNLRRNVSAPVLEGQYKGPRSFNRSEFSVLRLIIGVQTRSSVPGLMAEQVWGLGACMIVWRFTPDLAQGSSEYPSQFLESYNRGTKGVSIHVLGSMAHSRFSALPLLLQVLRQEEFSSSLSS
ncbi:uncharacterized protein AKAME5_002358800 [Lates japonicus]|uniref:Uncharacterized protein n=1 Tax=Lates japonicus TaxID=270547 RepID=A0AAD3NHS9_LATJO|nr:uncharacterized protein AKAME5_002358800 [Lates japonicus]